jgi:TolB-like protein
MTSWRSCSSRRRTVAAALALALSALTGCRHAGPPRPVRTGRLAVFPIQNATGGVAPIRPLTTAFDAELAARGVETVPRAALDEVLARHRFRFTGGVDSETARALRDELGVDVVLVPTLEQHDPGRPPRVALALRAVSAAETPLVLWADAVARSGEDAPGFLGLGVVESVADLERQVVVAAVAAVQRWIATGTRGGGCGSDFRFTPRRSFRAPVLDDVGRRTIAVLPFRNLTRRRDAEAVVVDHVVAQLTRSNSFEVLDPGAVREQILANRIVLENGVSIDRAMTLLDLLGADLFLSGEVRSFAAPGGPRLPPTVEFGVFVIDRSTAELVWSSRSAGEGDDWVVFFGAGRVYSASDLACRIARGVVDGIVGERGELAAYAAYEPQGPQRLRDRNTTAQFQRRPRDVSRRDSEQNTRGERARGVNQRRPRSAPPATQEGTSR